MSLTAQRTNPDTIPIPKKLSKIKKKKKNVALTHCNPNGLEKIFRKGKKKKSKSKMVNDKKASVASASLLPKENELSKLKVSTEVSSNWKNLQKNLPKADEIARPSRPAFVRKNKQGQIITNQHINHPKAVTIGLKKKSKNNVKEAGGDTTGAADTNVRQAGTECEVWFDDVDPLLLEHPSTELQDGTNGQGLVKPNSFKGKVIFGFG